MTEDLIKKLKDVKQALVSKDMTGEEWEEREEILEKLEGEERQLIGLRYFQDMTQTEVAKRMGVTQVQVSRMEKRILKKLREMEK